MKKVSIVIVTYRSEKDIYDCLASLFKWADISREYLEVIVVDNNSPEVERMFCGIRERYGDEIILINNSKTVDMVRATMLAYTVQAPPSL